MLYFNLTKSSKSDLVFTRRAEIGNSIKGNSKATVSFVHLHVHSSYSVLDGLASPRDLVKYTKELGMTALALTDHGTMFGTLDFFAAARAEGIKPIIGLEAYLAPRTMLDKDNIKDRKSYHLLLLAKNQTGYKNLLKIASVSQLEGFYYHPRIDKAFLAAHCEGLIGLSACLAGEIPQALKDNDLARAESSLNWYKEAFGPGNFYLELQDHNIPELYRVNRLMVELAKKTSTPLAATNDVHYARKEDAELQDILLCIQTGHLLTDINRMRMSDDSYYLRSPQEMQSIFSQVPEALSNTVLIAEQCEVDLTRTGYHLPKFEVPEGQTPELFLLELCQRGLRENLSDGAQAPEMQERLNYELGVINQMGFAEYFLIVWDLCRFSRENNIWYNVRGSGNGSLVAYALDITSVEPLSYHLLFERFLNPDRITMPDIDLDFPDDRRAEVMEYCNQKYGADKVAQIITFGTMAARGAVRDVGRVMNIPLVEVDRVAKAVPSQFQGKNIPLAESLEKNAELKALYESNEQYKRLIDVACRMEGSIRNVGTHAAGVIISDKPLTEYLPLHRPTNQSDELPIKSVAQYDMAGIDAMGLLKVDFLGLTTLTIMAKACEFIKERHNRRLNLSNIPIDDPEVFDYIGQGHTPGIFQLEGGGMTRYLMQMQPKTVQHVIAMVALYRPGPMEIIPAYIANMKGEVPVSYHHEKLEPILQETYGHTVYQEQIMQAAMSLAGYLPGESDDLRSAVSKKDATKVRKHRSKFVNGAVRNGIDKSTANQIFKHWEAFAFYGFNKSHATNYGIMAVKTAYLKYHYPVEYMTALLSAWKNDTDKTALYIAECREMGIEVLPPDVNNSGYDFTIEERPDGDLSIRFGLGAIKNVGQSPVEEIILGRKDSSDRISRPFISLNDFVRRVDLRKVGKRPLECLIKVGALDQLGERGSLLASLEQIANISASHFRAKEMGQMDLFGGSLVEETPLLVLQTYIRMSKKDQLDWEKELLGLYISDHPLNAHLRQVENKISHISTALAEAEEASKVSVGGVVNRMRPIRTKKDQMMSFVTLSDTYGDMDLVFFPKTWEKYSQIVDVGVVLLVEGKVQHRDTNVSVLVDKISVVTSNTDQNDLGESTSGPFYENTLERNLPDMRFLSRYAWPPVGEENDLTAEDSLEILLEEDPHSSWVEEPEYIEDPPLGFEFQTDYLDQEPDPLESAATIPSPDEDEPEELTQKPEEALEDFGYVDDEQVGQLPSQILVLTLPPGDTPERDQRRMSKYYGWLGAHPGRDLFGFRLQGPKGWRVVYFPNFPIEISDPLLSQLEQELGKENILCQPYNSDLIF